MTLQDILELEYLYSPPGHPASRVPAPAPPAATQASPPNAAAEPFYGPGVFSTEEMEVAELLAGMASVRKADHDQDCAKWLAMRRHGPPEVRHKVKAIFTDLLLARFKLQGQKITTLQARQWELEGQNAVLKGQNAVLRDHYEQLEDRYVHMEGRCVQLEDQMQQNAAAHALVMMRHSSTGPVADLPGGHDNDNSDTVMADSSNDKEVRDRLFEAQDGDDEADTVAKPLRAPSTPKRVMQQPENISPNSSEDSQFLAQLLTPLSDASSSSESQLKRCKSLLRQSLRRNVETTRASRAAAIPILTRMRSEEIRGVLAHPERNGRRGMR